MPGENLSAIILKNEASSKLKLRTLLQ